MARLSIIIVTYNSEKDIYDCLSSVMQHCDIPKSELEIIIVDNNSKEADSMFTKIRELFGEDIILVKNTFNGGYGQGNNVGISRASAPIILIMNPDVRLMQPIFAKAIADFDANHKIGIYGMKQMLSESKPSTNSFVCTYMMNGYLFTFLTGFCVRFDIYLQRYMYISGSCFFLRKEMFEQIGMFDESVFMYGEEDDIRCRMLERFGNCIKYNPRLRYIHLGTHKNVAVEYEKKLLEVAIKQNEKFGYPRRKTILNRLRNKSVLYWRARILNALGKKQKNLEVLDSFCNYLKSLLKE